MRKHPFRLETLEPRIMLSADPVDDEFYVDEVMAVEVAQMVPGTPAGGAAHRGVVGHRDAAHGRL